MSVRETITSMWMGFKTESEKTVMMDVDFLFELAKEEAPYRTDKEFEEDYKEILLREEGWKKSKRLKDLYDNWDDSKCEPLNIKKEGTWYMINDGFHRIIVAKRLGKKQLPVRLQEGKFVLTKKIDMVDIPELLDMLIKGFKKYKTFEELQTFIKSLDQNALKRYSIVYGRYDEVQ